MRQGHAVDVLEIATHGKTPCQAGDPHALAGQTGVDTIRLLRDYLAWERQPVLRRRAQAILRGLEASLA